MNYKWMGQWHLFQNWAIFCSLRLLCLFLDNLVRISKDNQTTRSLKIQTLICPDFGCSDVSGVRMYFSQNWAYLKNSPMPWVLYRCIFRLSFSLNPVSLQTEHEKISGMWCACLKIYFKHMLNQSKWRGTGKVALLLVDASSVMWLFCLVK